MLHKHFLFLVRFQTYERGYVGLNVKYAAVNVARDLGSINSFYFFCK